MDNFLFMVGIQGDLIRVINPGPIMRGLTKSEAQLLAAWLCVMSGDIDCAKVRELIGDM